MAAANARIDFHFLIPATLPHRTLLKKFIATMAKREGKRLQAVDYIFCGDLYLRKINKQFLGHSDFTDIITFDLSVRNTQIVSEIYISVERVRDNALAFGGGLNMELHRVIFHGILHLCGYKDKTPKDKQMMRTLEERYLKKYKAFVSRGTSS